MKCVQPPKLLRDHNAAVPNTTPLSAPHLPCAYTPRAASCAASMCRTTFTCNPSPTPSKHHDSYSSTRDEDTSLFDAAHQRISAGSCVWSLASYDTRPVLVSAPGASNNRVYRFGDVHATCSLNNQAERCGMPGCERMVLSLQVR